MTLEKFRSLKQEVKNLKTRERKQIADKLSQFRDTVDLLEDSSYTETLTEQADLEEQIDELEEMLENASIIKKRHTVHVNIGSTVEIRKMGERKMTTLKIVGAVDADPLSRAISNESPIGKALLGKKKGDIVEILLPTGVAKYKILQVH